MTQAKSDNPTRMWRLATRSAPDGWGTIHHLINSTMVLDYLPRSSRRHEARSPARAQLNMRCRLGNSRKKIEIGPVWRPPGSSCSGPQVQGAQREDGAFPPISDRSRHSIEPEIECL